MNNFRSTVRRIWSHLNMSVRRMLRGEHEDRYAVVDDAGTPTGATVSYYAAHVRGARHESVEVYVITPDGKLLLQRRSRHVLIQPGMWHSSASGHIVAGQTPLAAAQAEVSEELGIQLSPEELVFVDKVRSDEVFPSVGVINNEYKYLFVVFRDISLGDLHREALEVAELQLIPIAEFIQKIESRDPEYIWNPLTPTVIAYLKTHGDHKK